MPELQAVVQPVSQKTVYLNFFIRVVHKAIGVVVDWRNLAMTITADYLSHGGIMVDTHGHLRVIEPASGIMYLLQKQRFGELSNLQHLDANPAQVLILPAQFEFTDRLPPCFSFRRRCRRI